MKKYEHEVATIDKHFLMHDDFQKKTSATACSAVNMTWGPQSTPFQKWRVFFSKTKRLRPPVQPQTCVGVTKTYKNEIPIHKYWLLYNIGIKKGPIHGIILPWLLTLYFAYCCPFALWEHSRERWTRPCLPAALKKGRRQLSCPRALILQRALAWSVYGLGGAIIWVSCGKPKAIALYTFEYIYIV